jgi:hypothetical protein
MTDEIDIDEEDYLNDPILMARRTAIVTSCKRYIDKQIEKGYIFQQTDHKLAAGPVGHIGVALSEILKFLDNSLCSPNHEIRVLECLEKILSLDESRIGEQEQ